MFSLPLKSLINELNIKGDFIVNYITRAYHTRHGDGPFDMINAAELYLKDNIVETNVTDNFQGKFRKTILDVDLLLYAIKLSEYERQFPAKSKILVTCLDHLEEDNIFVQKNNMLTLIAKHLLERKLNNTLKF